MNFLKKKMRTRENNCSACPYYESHYDCYSGECDEYCGCDMFDKACYHPLFVLRLLALYVKMKSAFYDWKAEVSIQKDEKKRLALGMTEEEYDVYKYTH